MTEHERAARRRLVWLLLSRGDLGAETLRSDGMPALRPALLPERDEVAGDEPPEADAA